MAQTDATRAYIESVFSRVSQDGLGEHFLENLSDDVVWIAAGSSPVSGRYEGKAKYKERVLGRLRARLETPATTQVDRILADGDSAVVLFHSTGAKGRNGADFSMQYCWILKVQQEKIVEVMGFYDQKKMWDIFAES